MSTNCNEKQNSPTEEQRETTKPQNPSPNHEIQSEIHQNRGDTDRAEEEGNSKINDGEENLEAEISARESENTVPGEEDEGGCKTPTSIDHKIPAITQCPPAPRKARPQSSKLKRRAYSGARRSLRFLAEVEAESVFTPMSGLTVEERTKKARMGGGEDEI